MTEFATALDRQEAILAKMDDTDLLIKDARRLEGELMNVLNNIRIGTEQVREWSSPDTSLLDDPPM